jgi:hypothetical protein
MLSAEMAEPEGMTRRDVLNGTLLASGAALVSAACPFQLMAAEDRNGTAGIGDYAGANGNTHQVMADGQTIRDHAFDRAPKPIEDTGETLDCVIVNGGISGLAAALFYQRATNAKKSCLVLENHPIFGGEAKRNEFNVDEQRLIANQVQRCGSSRCQEAFSIIFMIRWDRSEPVPISAGRRNCDRCNALCRGREQLRVLFPPGRSAREMARGWSIRGRRSWTARRFPLRRSESFLLSRSAATRGNSWTGDHDRHLPGASQLYRA